MSSSALRRTSTSPVHHEPVATKEPIAQLTVDEDDALELRELPRSDLGEGVHESRGDAALLGHIGRQGLDLERLEAKIVQGSACALGLPCIDAHDERIARADLAQRMGQYKDAGQVRARGARQVGDPGARARSGRESSCHRRS